MVSFVPFLDPRRAPNLFIFVAFDDAEPKKNDSGHLKSSVILELASAGWAARCPCICGWKTRVCSKQGVMPAGASQGVDGKPAHMLAHEHPPGCTVNTPTENT